MPPGLRDKLEEHKVEGRTVFIITQNKLLSGSGLMYPKLIPALLSFVRKYSYILPNPLEIKLNFDDENYYARARDGDLLIINVIAYLNHKFELEPTFVHESVHLFQYRVSLYRELYNKKSIKLVEKLNLIDRSRNYNFWYLFHHLRLDLDHFYSNVSVEGLATFSEEFVNSVNFERFILSPQYELNNDFLKTRIWVDDLIRMWTLVINYFKKSQSLSDSHWHEIYHGKKGLKNIMDWAKYNIGNHMVKVCLYAQQGKNFEDIIKMSSFKFIKFYELCALSLGEKPLVSLTSGKGFLDYKRMLKELNEIYALYKKQGRLKEMIVE